MYRDAQCVYWNMHMFTHAPTTGAQKVIKYIVSGRWPSNHRGLDGLQKSGNAPASIHHHLLELSYSCGNGSFPHLWGPPHHPHITALNTSQNPADRVVLCCSGFTLDLVEMALPPAKAKPQQACHGSACTNTKTAETIMFSSWIVVRPKTLHFTGFKM